ncbi:TetR/AcrR family transcriptional regulator [Nocardia rhizosphaerihabitans]|uniref:TetR/AcrR family transcriptional regulator n=1 Tax=Nocardia rhizosphaerihabitans TaxID=1691570 RepID=UPI00366DB45A
MSTDRRGQIVAGAIDLIATRGIRALTHRAVDTQLELPAGSTSYYFRTRRALIEAVADGITARSRADFAATQGESPAAHEPGGQRESPAWRESGGESPGSTGDIARGVAGWLAHLLTHRRNDLIARHALIIETLADPGLHARLAGSLFSLERAAELFTALGAADPAAAAGDFLALLEGLVFDRFAGLRADQPATAEQLALPLSQFLASASCDYSQPNSE